MCLTEFNQEVYTESVKEEGRIEGRAEALAEGLEALVATLKQLITDNEGIFQLVIKNDAYKNLTREEVFKYL